MTDKPLLEAYVDAYFSTFKNINELISEPMAAYHLSFEQYRILSDIANDPKFEADRRRNMLQLTPLGKQVEAAITKNANEQFNEWVAALGERKAKQFVKLLNEIGSKVIRPQQAAKKNR